MKKANPSNQINPPNWGSKPMESHSINPLKISYKIAVKYLFSILNSLQSLFLKEIEIE